MKILYHHRTRAEDAQGIHIMSLSLAFQELGHVVYLVDLLVRKNRSQPQTDAQKQGNSIAGVEIPHWLYEVMALGYNLPAFFALSLKILKTKPDFIYERYSIFMLCGLIAAKLFKLPFVLEVNAPLSLEMKTHGSLTFQKFAKSIENYLFRNATRTIFVSAAMKKIVECQGMDTKRHVVMHNGIDPKRFHPSIDSSPIRQLYDWNDKIVIGFVGWMRPWHGLDILIDAFAEKHQNIPAIRLLLVGDGPAVPELTQQIQRLGLAEKIKITGAVTRSDVPRYIAAMDIAVQPDVTDYASPIKLFEYMAMGKAIIAANKSNITEIIENEKHALLYEVKNTSALANKLARLAKDADCRQRLGAAASQVLAEKGFLWQANAERVIAMMAAQKTTQPPGIAGKIDNPSRQLTVDEQTVDGDSV